MRYSLTNLLETATITVTGVSSSLGSVDDLFDRRTVKAYAGVQSGALVTITVTLAAAADFDTVVLVGTTGITGTVTATVGASAPTGTVVQPIQQNYIEIPFSPAANGTVLTVTFDVGDTNQFSIGYLYAGQLSTTLTVATESWNYAVDTTYPVNITRAGTALTSLAYNSAAVDFATQEEDFTVLRARTKLWATEGYATPRLWIFDETCFDETVYGIIDAARVPLDVTFVPSNPNRATTTLALQETF